MPARPLRLMSATLLVWLALTGVAAANLFTSPPIPVDIRAAGVGAARNQAIAEARGQGLMKVMMRLTAKADHARLPVLTGPDLQAIATTLQISDERTGPNRYIARIAVSFDADAVRRLLGGAGIAFTEARAMPVLIVPVLTRNGLSSIWRDPNPWLEAWARHDGSQQLAPPVVPFGDVEDIITLSASQALAGESAPILALARRYGVESALVVHAALDIDPVNGNAVVGVNINSYGRDRYRPILINVSGSAAHGAESFLSAVVELALTDINNQWKADMIGRFDIESELLTEAPVKDLRDWLDLSQRLATVNQVRRLELRELSINRALIRIVYGGDEDGIVTAMSRTGLVLARSGGNNGGGSGLWSLSRQGAGQTQ